MTALGPPLRAAGFSLRDFKGALALAGIATPRGLKPATRVVSGNLALSYYKEIPHSHSWCFERSQFLERIV